MGPCRKRLSELMLCYVLAACTLSPMPAGAAASWAEAAEPNADEVEVIFFLAGVSPDSLAAGGVRAEDVVGIVQDGLDTLLPSHEAFAQAKAQYVAAKAEFERLDRLVRGGRATEQERAARDAAAKALAQALGQLDAFLDALLTAAVRSLPAERAEAVGSVAKHRGRALPTEYLTVERDEPGWVSLRDALADVRISERLGQSPDPESVQEVLKADAHPRVAAAKVGLESLPLVRAAWDKALGR